MSTGYESLKAAVEKDCLDHGGTFHPEGCCNCTPGCAAHAFCEKFKWVIDRAKQYGEITGLDWNAILDAWEEERPYWYMNYYQEATFPKPDGENVHIFDTEADFEKAVGDTGYRCPRCGKVCSWPYTHTTPDDAACGFVLGLVLPELGDTNTAYVFFKDTMRIDEIFMPIAWETAKSQPES